MKMTLLNASFFALIVIGAFYGCSPKTTDSVSQPSNPPTRQAHMDDEENPYNGLRQMALNFTPEELGLEVSNKNFKAFGIVMDWDLGNGIATLSVLATGDVSMYLSTGGGYIGGGQHENVRKAGLNYLKVGQEFLDKATLTEETPLPARNTVNFFFLTNKGKYVGREGMANIDSGNSDWTNLFVEANKVLTQLRLATESN